MDGRGIPFEVVCYEARSFKHWPPYAGIAENMLTNATLPSTRRLLNIVAWRVCLDGARDDAKEMIGPWRE